MSAASDKPDASTGRAADRSARWRGVADRSVRLLSPFYAFRVPVLAWSTAYFLLWCYRTVFSVLGDVVVMRLTNIADTRSYQRQELLTAVDNMIVAGQTGGILMQAAATALTKLIGGVFGLLSFNNPIAINIGFQTIGFLGMLAFLRALDPRDRRIVYGLFLLPSITVWSSIATKEALLVGFVGVVCAHIVKFYKNEEGSIVVPAICLFLVGVFKPHFMPALLLLLGVSYLARYTEWKTTLALLALIASLLLLYVMRERVDEFARYVDWALLSMGGNSAREPFIVEVNDVFLKAPLGMYLAFAGPTLSEAGKGLLHALTFTESIVIVFVMVYFMVRRLPVIPAYSFILALGALFWILFATYPPAVSNPGTAIRYRTGYILIVFLCFVILPSRSMYIDWINGWRARVMARNRRGSAA